MKPSMKVIEVKSAGIICSSGGQKLTIKQAGLPDEVIDETEMDEVEFD